MIEKALYEDLEEILALQKLAYQSEAMICNDYGIPPLTQTIDGIREDFHNQIILKAVGDNRIIGSIRAYEKDGTCFIGRVIVHPEFQNRGVGKKLMLAVEDMFPECHLFSLFTGKNSVKNLYFYGSLGYKQVREEYIHDTLTFVYLEKVK
ncbi:MAG TPA: GNAT family N-acetyltransferase [Clostridia bacterium]|nr:GNAT family N-acetyltransferase [Clostridia bacterium]